MAFFYEEANGTTGVEIVPATPNKRPRFLAFGIAALVSTARTYTFYDGTALAGTARFLFTTASTGAPIYYFTEESGGSVFPPTWFTVGNAVEFALNNTGTTNYIVYGEYVLE